MNLALSVPHFAYRTTYILVNQEIDSKLVLYTSLITSVDCKVLNV